MKIVESIANGMLKLNDAKDKYKKIYEQNVEKKQSFEVVVELTQDESKQKMNNLQKKVDAVDTRMKYVDFILKELKGIKNFVEIEEKPDFVNHCIYFGSGTLYYSKEFLNLSSIEIFDTILNHIFYYTGCLYIINNKDIRMSYILTAFAICCGNHVNFKDGKYIYKKYKNELKYNVFDINKNYRKFIMRNHELVNFFHNMGDINSSTIHMTYRIIFGNIIKLQNMRIKIEDEKFSISEINKEGLFFSRYDQDQFFELA